MALKFAGFFNSKWGEPIPGKDNQAPVFVGVDTHSFKWGSPANSRTYPNELSFVIDPFSTQLKVQSRRFNLL